MTGISVPQTKLGYKEYGEFNNLHTKLVGFELDGQKLTTLQKLAASGDEITRKELQEVLGFHITDASWKAFISGFGDNKHNAIATPGGSLKNLNAALEKFNTISEATGQTLRYFFACRIVINLDSRELLAGMKKISNDDVKLANFVTKHQEMLKKILGNMRDKDGTLLLRGIDMGSLKEAIKKATDAQLVVLGAALIENMRITAERSGQTIPRGLDLSGSDQRLVAQRFVQQIFIPYATDTDDVDPNKGFKNVVPQEEIKDLDQLQDDISLIRQYGMGSDLEGVDLTTEDNNKIFKDLVADFKTNPNDPAKRNALREGLKLETAGNVAKNQELAIFIARHKDKFRYDDATGTLVVKGKMSESEKNELSMIFYNKQEENDAIAELFKQSQFKIKSPPDATIASN